MKNIMFKGKDLPRLLNQYLVLGKNGYLRLPKKGEKPRYALGIVGFAITLFDLEKDAIQFLETAN